MVHRSIRTNPFSPLECFLNMRAASQSGNHDATLLIEKWAEYRRFRGFEFVDENVGFKKTITYSGLMLLFALPVLVLSAIGSIGAALTGLVYHKKR